MKEYKGYCYDKEGETYTVFTKDGKPWIVDFETEEKAKSQIDDIVKNEEEKNTLENLQEQVTNLELALAELVEGGTL